MKSTHTTWSAQREALHALEYAGDMTKPEDLQWCGYPIHTNITVRSERLGEKT